MSKNKDKKKKYNQDITEENLLNGKSNFSIKNKDLTDLFKILINAKNKKITTDKIKKEKIEKIKKERKDKKNKENKEDNNKDA